MKFIIEQYPTQASTVRQLFKDAAQLQLATLRMLRRAVARLQLTEGLTEPSEAKGKRQALAIYEAVAAEFERNPDLIGKD